VFSGLGGGYRKRNDPRPGRSGTLSSEKASWYRGRGHLLKRKQQLIEGKKELPLPGSEKKGRSRPQPGPLEARRTRTPKTNPTKLGIWFR